VLSRHAWRAIWDFGNHVSLETQFVALRAAAPHGVHLGKDPFIDLADGSRLSIGNMIGATGKIMAIQADKIRIRTASGCGPAVRANTQLDHGGPAMSETTKLFEIQDRPAADIEGSTRG
jgi:hypothetical protein